MLQCGKLKGELNEVCYLNYSNFFISNSHVESFCEAVLFCVLGIKVTFNSTEAEIQEWSS